MNSGLLVFQWNARGIESNGSELQQYIHTQKSKPHVICLQETWLPIGRTYDIPNYSCINKPRLNGNRGGCATYIRYDISYKIIDTPNDQEYQLTSIEFGQTKLTIINFYNPCQTISVNYLDLIIAKAGPKFLFCGDFNAHNKIWGSAKTDHNGLEIEKFIDKNNLIFLNDGSATRQDPVHDTFTCIDLTLATQNLGIKCNWSVNENNFNSDHFLIEISTSIYRQMHSNNNARQAPQSWSFRKADWEKYKQILNKTSFVYPSKNVQEIYDYFIDVIQNAADQSIPKTNPNKHPPPIPWWNDECKQAIKNRNRAKRKAIKSMIYDDVLEYKKLKALAQRITRTAKKTYWANYCNTLNRFSSTKEIWKKVKKLTNIIDGNNDKGHIPLNLNGTFINDNYQKANTLADYFGNCMNYADTDHETYTSPPHLPENNKLDCNAINDHYTLNELKWAISKSNDSTPGEDRISKQLIANLPENALQNLLYIMNVIWDTSIHPKSWTHAIIVPIPKPGKERGVISSYRPISLTPYLCKLMERMMSLRLNWFLEKHKIISPLQTGFRQNINIMDNPIRLERDVFNTFAEGQYLICVYLDYMQAFDTVWRQALTIKMKCIGIHGNMLNWITNFITNRTFQVKVNGHLSSIRKTQRGLPQGSVLSPTLFNIYINDVVQTVKHSSMALFADDIAIWSRNKDPRKLQNDIQNDLNNIEIWSTKWKLKLSVPKTKTMTFTRKPKPELNFKLYNNDLENVKDFKFLGVTFDSRLKWDSYIDRIIVRCKRKLNLLKMTLGTAWGPDTKTAMIFYRALIRSVIDYGSELYGSASSTTLSKLTSIQYKSLQMITNTLPTTSLEALQVECGEPPFGIRRKMYDEFYKTRLLSIDQSLPVAQTLKPYWQDNIIEQIYGLMNTHRRPLAVRTKEYQERVECTQISPTPPWELVPLSVHFDIHKQCTTNDDPNLRKLIAMDYINLIWKDKLHIYTDGSKDPQTGKTSSSFFIPKFKVSKATKISPISVCRAEQIAILLALSWLEQFPPSDVLILTDSLSSLYLLANTLRINSNTILEIVSTHSKLTKKGFKIAFAWIPAHCGIHGNEMADTLAKKALNRKYIQLPIARNNQELKSIIKKDNFDIWQRQWSHSLHGRPLHYIQPYVRNTNLVEGLCRRDETIIHRLRVGKVRLGEYLHKIKRRPHNKCLACDNVESAGHYLMFCKKYNKERATLRERLNIEELSIKKILNPKNTPHLIQYVKDTKMYHIL